MQVNALDHVNIRTKDVATTARFYAEILGLEQRNGPMSLPPDKVQWLYDVNNRPIVHVAREDVVKGDTQSGHTGSIDHVAFNCSGKADLLDRLKKRDLKYSVSEIPELGRTLVFVTDPHGIRLELNFSGD